MHKLLLRVLTIVMMTVVSAASSQALDIQPRRGVVRVKLQSEMARRVGNKARVASRDHVLTTGVAPLDASVKKIKGATMRRLIPYSEKLEAKHAAYGLDRWYEITFDESIDPLEARQILSKTAGVQAADAVVPMRLTEGNGQFRVAGPVKASSANMPFNDPRLPAQWHYHNDGSIADTRPGADINLFEAWKTTAGKSNVIVAIVDGGIDVNHEDLAANVLVNEAELNGLPGVDDDGNGYVDDIYGYNFVTNSPEIYPHSHGTHVAGTVAAVNNNGIGVAGVAGGDGTPGSGVKMISCQVFDSRSGSGEGNFASAIVYAADRGASIAQCSWGWPSDGYYEQAVLDAIDYFTAEARSDVMTGGLCIFAPGNDGLTGNFYPACYDKVLAVTAMTSQGLVAPYSNNGPWADVTAPGGLLDYSTAQGVLSTLPDNEYGYNEGTSMATPHVSGIAALILSAYGKRDMVSETLSQQIVTSVNDFYSLNPSAAGLFGSGYVDAAKALRMGSGAAPSPVTDMILSATQDEIVVEWTIPQSEDGVVNHHIIYYSKEPFSADGLSKASSVVVDTKFANAGEKFDYELTGLSPLTTYYVAIVAVDRWGNASELSEVKQTTTNAGPEMTVSYPAGGISLNIDANASPTASATFSIGNNAEGLLKWSAYKRTVSASLASVDRPNPGLVGPYNGKLDGQRLRGNDVVTVEDYNPGDYPKTMTDSESIYAYIGDSDPKLPNSLAQMFTVSPSANPDGFNLTHVSLQGAHGEMATIEVYRGATISSAAKLISFQPDFFMYNYDLQLPEQLYFAPGESFWIVAHFEPSETLYPLGLGLAKEGYNSNASYISNDCGKTWTRLNEALRGSAYASIDATWAVTAKSVNPDWASVLVLNPSEGSLRNGETQEVEVSNDGQRLINGTYRASVRFTTNESENSLLSVPVTITVQGSKPEIIGPKVVDFGSLLVGQSKTMTIEVFNQGYGLFRSSQWGNPAIYSDNITSSSDQFRGPDYVQGGFPSRSKSTFEVTFAPTEAGSHTGVITFTDILGIEYKLTVQGAATDPAKIVIDPEIVDGGTLTLGDEPIEKQFTISNKGKYPLEFVLPRYSDETLDADMPTAHKFGYTIVSNLNGSDAFAYDGNPELLNSTDISSQFTDDVYLSKAIDLGFEFPYYGSTYDKVYVTSFGGICFAPNESTLRSPLTPTSYGVPGTGLISAWGFQMPISSSSRVEYAKQDGKFVVKFIDTMGIVNDKDYTPISFHIVLSANGDIEIFYDNYDPWLLFNQGAALYVGINDLESKDPLTLTSADTVFDDNTTVHSEFTTGTAVKFVAPKPYFVKSIAPASGLIIPGQSMTLTATLQASDEMYAGETFNNVVILSNDPAQSTATVRFDAVISGDELVPVASVESKTTDFGKVFRGADAVKAVTLKNAGRDVMTVNSVKIEGAAFSTDIETPFKIEAGMSKDILVTIATATEGRHTGTLNVSTDGGDLTVDLSGEVIGAPAIELSYTEITETAESGTVVDRPLSITNSGDETLTFSIIPNSMIQFPADTGDDSRTAYAYTASVDSKDVTFDWIDIVNNGQGTRHDFNYYNNHDFVAVDLPFSFPFYGKAYDKMYIYNTGFASFTERDDQRIWPEPPAEFPAGSIYTNLIAPYWGLHSMDVNSTAGTYFHVTETQAVVSWMEYGNSMNLGICFQLIMNADGTFKFQYKAINENAVWNGLFGMGGISNIDGSEGFKLSERVMTFNNAVEFIPVVETSVAPQVTKTVDIKLPVTQMAGEYQSAITVKTNVPHNETIEIPVNLTVTGTAKPVFPADITITHPIGYMEFGTGPMVEMGAPYEAYFKVENLGTAPFTIESVEYVSPTMIDEWFGDEIPLFDLWCLAEQEDWMTGEIIKGWTQYFGQPMTVSREGAEFSFPAMNIGYEPGEYEIPVTFHLSGLEGVEQKSMTVKFVVTPAPMITPDREEIAVTGALPGDIKEETLSIANFGEYPLTFSLRLDPTGEGETLEIGGGGGVDQLSATDKAEAKAEVAKIAAELQPVKIKAPAATFETGSSDSYLDTPADVEFTNALYHPVPSTGNVSAFLFGSFNNYDYLKTSTLYTSPEGGINITDIYTTVNYGTATDKDITVEIILGESPLGSSILGSGKFHLDKMTNPQLASVILIPLDRETFVPEGMKFCVVVTYEAGAPTPTMLVAKADDVVADRYQAYYDSYGWYDPATYYRDENGSLGFVATCIERVPGSFWVKVLDDVKGVTVQPGEAFDIKVKLEADRAPLNTGNRAMLVVKSDDPANPIVNIPVVLDKNLAPVIKAETATVYVDEATKVETALTVTEPENEAMTIEIADNGTLATIASATAENGVEPTIDGLKVNVPAEAGAVTVKVALAPDYGQAGNYSFTVTAADANTLTADATVNYAVAHVNRGPVAVETAPVKVAVGSASEVVNLADLFNDPDNDELTFTVTLRDETLAQSFLSSGSVIFYGLKAGETVADVKATDPAGLTATAELPIVVDDKSGISEIGTDNPLSVYPNPVDDQLNVSGLNAATVRLTLISLNGSTVLDTEVATSAGRASTAVGHIASGSYILVATAEGQSWTTVVVKR